jgi:hypothetical protein
MKVYESRGIFQEAVVTHFNVLSHRLLIDIEENHEKQSLATVWSKILNKDLSNASKVLPATYQATLRFKLYRVIQNDSSNFKCLYI